MDYEIYILDQIISDPFMGGVSASYVKDEIKLAKEAGAKKLVVHINSPGGVVYEGYAIYNLLKQSGLPVETICQGMCASIASLVFLAGSVRKMSKLGQIMIHNPYVGLEGDADALRRTADQLDQIKSQVISAYLSKTKLTEDELAVMMDKETWIGFDEALQFGFVTDEMEINNKNLMAVMNKANTKKQGLIKDIKALVSKVLSSTAMNGTRNMEDGTPVYFDGEQIEVGTKLFSDAEMTQAVPDAAHRMDIDGMIWIITTQDGTVTEMAQDSDDPLEQMKAELAKKDEQIQALISERDGFKSQVDTLTGTLTNVSQRLEELERIELGSNFKPVSTAKIPGKKESPDKQLFGGVVQKWVSGARYQKQA